MMAAVKIAEFRNLMATTPTMAGLEWDELAARLLVFSEREHKDGPGWSPATYPAGKTRGNDDVENVTAAVIDIDHAEPDWGLIDTFEYVAHTTFSHGQDRPGCPHWRIVLPLERPVARNDWGDIWKRIHFWLAPGADESCKDESRFYWWPTCKPGATRDSHWHRGIMLDPAKLRDIPEERPRLTPVDQVEGYSGPSGERPGDRYTRETDWSDILVGWRLLSTRGSERRWQRPDNGIPKQTPGCSATTGGGGHDVLYVFSSNAPPFEPNKSYSKFRAYTLLNHGGDDRVAAAALSERYWGTMRVIGSTRMTSSPPDATTPPERRLRPLSADQLLLGEPTPVPWLIHAPPADDGSIPGGLLAEGDIGIIGAASGTGKTWLGAELSFSLATMVPLFDQFIIARPCRVMVMDEESSAWLLRRRWLKVLKGHGAEPTNFVERYWANLSIYVDQGFSFDDDRSLAALYEEARAFKPDIILFDTLARVHRRPENDNSAIASLFEDRIKPFKRELGCAILFMHHVRKTSKDAPNDPASMLRGASDLKGQLDQFWFLRGRSGDPRAIFEHDKCRAMPELSAFVIERIDTPDGGVRIVQSGGIGAVGAAAGEQHQEVLLTYLIDNDRATRQELVDFGKGRGIARSSVDVALKALVEAGQIDRAKLGRETVFFPSEME